MSDRTQDRGMPGVIVVLNGAPRAGKSTIAAEIQRTFPGVWMNFGVDAVMSMTPPDLLPGIGLRPGGERPDLEREVKCMYAAMYDAIAAYSRQGLNVVVDVGHHDDYSEPLRTLPDAAHRLAGLLAWLVGVRCSLDEVMARRDAAAPADRGYLGTAPDGSVPAPVQRWQEAVHVPGIYDLEIDTTTMSSDGCAALIRDRLDTGPPPSALVRLAAM